MFKGKVVKKGGTRFPNYSIKQVLPCLKDLLSKTHTKPISIQQLNSGVFGMNPQSANGGVKYSALKQYGLADGKYESITSTDLTSNIVHTTGDEKIKFIREAFFNVKTFKNTFETYQDSVVNKDKIKGYVSSTLGIHPDSTAKFLESFIESAKEANLCSVSGDEITFANGKDIHFNEDSETAIEEENEQLDSKEENESNNKEPKEHLVENDKGLEKSQQRIKNSVPTIELKIDPTLDPDKLEKQLAVLRKFGLV